MVDLFDKYCLINVAKMPPDLKNIMMAAVILEKSEFMFNTQVEIQKLAPVP